MIGCFLIVSSQQRMTLPKRATCRRGWIVGQSRRIWPYDIWPGSFDKIGGYLRIYDSHSQHVSVWLRIFNGNESPKITYQTVLELSYTSADLTTLSHSGQNPLNQVIYATDPHVILNSIIICMTKNLNN